MPARLPPPATLQFSPCKAQFSSASPSHRVLRPSTATLLQALGDGSPTGVADAPAAPSTASQPSSATSSLAATLADLAVTSRQSSANDLGDRRQLLQPAALHPLAAARLHSRCSSGDQMPPSAVLGAAAGEEAAAAAAASGGGAAPARRDAFGLSAEAAAGLCSPKQVSAVRCFDSLVLKKLSPIKTRSRAATAGEQGGNGAVGAAGQGRDASPAVAYAESLVSPFEQALKVKHAAARPLVFHSSRGSWQAPGSYNPYDTTAAALSSGGWVPG